MSKNKNLKRKREEFLSPKKLCSPDQDLFKIAKIIEILINHRYIDEGEYTCHDKNCRVLRLNKKIEGGNLDLNGIDKVIMSKIQKIDINFDELTRHENKTAITCEWLLCLLHKSMEILESKPTRHKKEFTVIACCFLMYPHRNHREVAWLKNLKEMIIKLKDN